MNDQQKSAIAERLAVAEHCLLEGADEYLQVKLACEKFYCFVCSTSRHICYAGDGCGHFHDENAGHGLKIGEGEEGESSASLVTLKVKSVRQSVT